MPWLEQGAEAVRAELRLLAIALRDWRLLAALVCFAALLLLAAQIPLRYTIEVGLEEGYGSDLPLVAGFHAPEYSPFAQLNFRWTAGQSQIRLPGVGGRPLKLTVRLLPIDPSIAPRSPEAIDIWANGRRLGQLATRPATGATYTLLLMPPDDGSAGQVVDIRSATFTPPGDRRAIGVPVEQVRVESVAGLARPDWGAILSWLGAGLLLWLALRRIDLTPAFALTLLLAGVLLASLAALGDPPRFAFGATAALVACGLGWLLALLLTAAPHGLRVAGPALALLALGVVLAGGEIASSAQAALLGAAVACALAGWLRPALARLYRRRGPPVPGYARRWLLLFALLVLATHYGGKIYPDAMWGDIGFHANRYQEVVQGRVLLLSRNRGVDFPYPPALYLLLAPFALTGLDHRVLLQLGGALLNALSPFVIYAIVAGAFTGDSERRASRIHRVGILAAGIYACTAATLMTMWWNFSTHIFTQFVHLLLIAALVLGWPWATTDERPPTNDRARGPWSLSGLLVLQSLIYLGHFGFWINLSLLGAFSLAALLLGALGGRVPWRAFQLLLAVFIAAEVVAIVFFYSAYAGLFLEQARATAAGGLSGMANRPVADRAALWEALWDAGFRVHFGFFPVPLALCGMALLLRQRPQRAASLARAGLVVLIVGTFGVALLFGALPFVTRAALSTRWLMFSAWAIALCAALAVDLLWRAGWAGRWLVAAMGGYLGWVTASMWLGALAWRIRPPEPF